jgi:hypothetical protein
MSKISNTLKDIKDKEEPCSKICYVRRVSTYSLTIDVEPIDSYNFNKDIPNSNNYIMNVQLTPRLTILGKEGQFRLPKKDSYVIVSFLNKNQAFVSCASAIENVTIEAKDVKVSLNGGDILFENFDKFRINTVDNTILNLQDQEEIAILNIVNFDRIKLLSNDNYVQMTIDDISIKTINDKIGIYKSDKVDIVQLKKDYKVNVVDKRYLDITWGLMYYFAYYYSNKDIGISITNIESLASVVVKYEVLSKHYNDILMRYTLEAICYFSGLEITDENISLILTKPEKFVDLHSVSYAKGYENLRNTAIANGIDVSMYDESLYKIQEKLENYTIDLEYYFDKLKSGYTKVIIEKSEYSYNNRKYLKYNMNKYNLDFYIDFFASVTDTKRYEPMELSKEGATYTLNYEELDALYNDYILSIKSEMATYGIPITSEMQKWISIYLPSTILKEKETKITDIFTYFYDLAKKIIISIIKKGEEWLNLNAGTGLLSDGLKDIITTLNNSMKNMMISDTAIPSSGTVSIERIIALTLNETNINSILK